MTDRITQADLENLLSEINRKRHGTPKPKYGTPLAYMLDYAYGGVKLVQMCDNGTGQRDISAGGFGTKRELYNFMRGMVA